MVADPLSDALAVVHARCTITGGFTAAGDWAMRFRPTAPLKLDAVVRGGCWFLAEDRPPMLLEAGDVLVLNRTETVVLASDPGIEPVEAADTIPEGAAGDTGLPHVGTAPPTGAETVLIGGHVEMNANGHDLLLATLPRTTLVTDRHREAAELRRILTVLLEERFADRPGARFASAEYAQLLLLEVLRLLLRQGAAERPGWLGLLSDPALRPALALIHEDPARAWTLEELARAASMSRSAFASRFKKAAAQPAVAYLNRWRIRLAQQALRETDTTVAALASTLGYASESSLSHAFRRVIGVTPGQYRRATRTPETVPSVR
ncbi:AraC family transcriptional regulator [Streptomyces sp. NPDC026672]|uniref:AraC family transcriptional regulator n=1 Tax=unclassified Streptomyces TaxID=2593676 RepID=UPI0033DBC209